MGDQLMVDPPGRDTPAFVVPSAGAPAYVGPGPGYHAYRAETSAPGTDQRDVNAIGMQLVSRPTLDPGARPATRQGVLNDGGISPFPGPYDDKVISYRTTDLEGEPVVVNVTVQGGHVLSPGYVAQYEKRNGGGTKVLTVGEGNAAIQRGPGAWLGKTLFNWKNADVLAKGLSNARR